MHNEHRRGVCTTAGLLIRRMHVQRKGRLQNEMNLNRCHTIFNCTSHFFLLICLGSDIASRLLHVPQGPLAFLPAE
jgi:hypothetical protein